MEQFIVEILTRPDGPSHKRSSPKGKRAAERLAASLEVAGLITRIVPAEKYAYKGVQERVETPLDVESNRGRSRVE